MENDTLQKRLGMLFSSLSLLLLITHYIKGFLVYHMSFLAITTNISNIEIFIALAFFTVTSFLVRPWCRTSQIITVFVVAALVIVYDHDSFYGVSLFISGAALMYRYGYLERSIKIKAPILLVSYMCMVEIGSYIENTKIPVVSFDALLFVALEGAFLWLLFVAPERREKRENEHLEHKITEDRPYTEMGESIGGLIHNLKNDIVAIMSGVDLIAFTHPELKGTEEYELLVDAAEKLRAKVWNCTALVRARKTDGQTTHDGRGMLLGLRDVFESLPGFIQSVTLSINTPETLPVFGTGENIAQVFENILKNSFEAIQAMGRHGHINVYGVSEGLTTMVWIENDAGLMPQCAGCAGGSCMTCKRIGEGKTTKAAGSGIGLAYVRRVMAAMGGEMRIEQTAAGVRTVLRFRSGAAEEAVA